MQLHFSASLVPAALGGTAMAQSGPSFGCAKAEGRVETLVWGDAELLQLDRETARLCALELDGPHMPAERRTTKLVPFQRGWDRCDCWKDANVAARAKGEYLIGIAELPQPCSTGARYAAPLDDGDYLFWNAGDEATFGAPGVAGSRTCTLGPGG